MPLKIFAVGPTSSPPSVVATGLARAEYMPTKTEPLTGLPVVASRSLNVTVALPVDFGASKLGVGSVSAPERASDFAPRPRRANASATVL